MRAPIDWLVVGTWVGGLALCALLEWEVVHLAVQELCR